MANDGSSTGKPDLFPKNVLAGIAAVRAPDPLGPRAITVPDAHGGHELVLPGALEFTPATLEEADASRRTLLGPSWAALTMDPADTSGFTEQLTAESALALLPAALIGSLAKPYADKVYAWIDKIPEAIRRPFEKDFGLLIDNALCVAGAAVSPLVDQTVARFHPDGSGLPPSASVPIQAFGQEADACGEVAAATILKAAGVPASLSEVDTQLSGAGGQTGLVEAELRRRGLTVLSGPGDLVKLKSFVAAGIPVILSIGWPSGGGHYCVVSGYDDAARRFTVLDYDGRGGTVAVPYDELAASWKRHLNYMAACVPRRDPRLDALLTAADPRRPTPIYPGFSLSDFWVTQDKQVFVEGAYRYMGQRTDITVRVSFDSTERGLARRLNGGVALQQKLDDDWVIGVTIDKLSVQGRADDWHQLSTAPLSIYGTLTGPGFELKAGTERGGFQAEVAADLGRFIAGLGLDASLSVDADGTYRVLAMISGSA